jgi:hypothetical protein
LRSRLKFLSRAAAGVAALAVVAAAVPVSTTPVLAFPPDAPFAGAITLTPSTGNNSGTVVAPSFPASVSQTCPGDVNAGYRAHSFIIPITRDPGALTFQGTGEPTAVTSGVGAGFSQSLRTISGFIRNINPSITDAIVALPGTVTFSSTGTYGALPAGQYWIGFACVDVDLPAPQLTDKYWATPITITAQSGAGPNNFNWSVGVPPAAPAITSVVPSNATLTVNFTHAASTPATTGYTLSATPQGGGTTTTVNPAAGATSGVLTGLTNGTTYDISLTATNSSGTSPAATATGTPGVAPQDPFPLSVTSTGAGQVTVSFTVPGAPAPLPTGLSLAVSPSVTGSPFTIAPSPAGPKSQVINGLTPGSSYTFTLTRTYASPDSGGPSSATYTLPSAQTLIQDLTVVRPVGALVLTQRCGVYGSTPEYTDNVFGTLPAIPATTNADPGPTGYAYGGLPAGTAPTLTPGGTGDPLFPQYPYPTDGNGDSIANYPTYCGVDMGRGRLITSGPRAGQYFTATGRMNQITVVNTQDTDGGFTINGRMSTFTRTGGGDSFSGNLLGWDPEVTYDSSANLDGYDMVVTAGGVRQPVASSSTDGLGDVSNETNTTLAKSLAKSLPNQSLGMAVLDARLRLLIPVQANSGTYTGTLTFTTV